MSNREMSVFGTSVNQLRDHSLKLSRTSHDVMFYRRWSQLVKSPLYLLFAIIITLSEILNIGELSSIINDLKSTAQIASLIEIDGNGLGAMLQLLEISMVVFIILRAAFLIGIWKIYIDVGGKERNLAIGVKVVLGVYWVSFALVAIAFLFTLPIFTDWLEYDKIFSLPLQIAYLIYIAAMIYDAIVIAVLSKIADNLQFWNGATGPIGCLSIGNIIFGILMLVSILKVEFSFAGMLLMLSSFMMGVLLLWYRGIMDDCQKEGIEKQTASAE